MALTTTSTITPLISGFVSRTPMDVARDTLCHLDYAEKLESPPNGSGTRWTGRRPTKLTKQTTAMTEGTTPASNTLGVTDVAINLQQWGNYYTISDVAKVTEPLELVNMYGPLLQLNAAETIDRLGQQALVGGSNVFYANGVGSRGAVNSKLVTTDLDKAIRFLRSGAAQPVTKTIEGSAGIGTNPIEQGFVMMTHPDVAYDVEGLAGFIEVQKYASQSQRLPGEFGAYKSVRFVRTIHADNGTGQVGAVGTATYKDDGTNYYVYLSPIVAAKAYGQVDWAGGITPTAAQGASDADPLAQRESHGWKAMTAVGRLNEAWLVRMECAASE